MEDHMFHVLFYLLTTQDAVEVLADVVMPPFEHIACVEFVKEE